MKQYFMATTEIEAILERFDQVEDSIRGKQIISEILNSKYLKEYKHYQMMRPMNYSSTGKALSKESLCELNTDFFISRGICNVFPDGRLNEVQTNYHTHNYIEIIYIYEGTYTHYINGIKYEHKKGDVCILNTNVLHRDGVIKKDDFVVYLCLGMDYIDRSKFKNKEKFNHLNTLLDHTVNKHAKDYIFFENEKDEVESIIENIAKEHCEKLVGYQKIIEGYIERLLYVLFTDYKGLLISEGIEKIENRIFLEIDQVIRERIHEITRTELAEIFYYSPDHINRIIKQNTGESYSDYTKEVKLEYARKLLVEDKMSVNDIIRKLGYSNKTYFYKIFTSKYQITPKEYRGKYKK